MWLSIKWPTSLLECLVTLKKDENNCEYIIHGVVWNGLVLCLANMQVVSWWGCRCIDAAKDAHDYVDFAFLHASNCSSSECLLRYLCEHHDAHCFETKPSIQSLAEYKSRTFVVIINVSSRSTREGDLASRDRRVMEEINVDTFTLRSDSQPPTPYYYMSVPSYFHIYHRSIRTSSQCQYGFVCTMLQANNGV